MGKSVKLQDYEKGMHARKVQELRESQNIDTLGRRFADLSEFVDVAGRTWKVAAYWGIAKSGGNAGKKIYYLTTDRDIAGGPASPTRIRTEEQLIAAKTDLYVLLSGIEQSEYKRVHGGLNGS